MSDERDEIDFEVGDAPSTYDDEELAQPPTHRARLRWTFGGAAVVLAAAVVLVDRGRGDHSAAASSTPTGTGTSTVFSLPPDVGGVTQPVRIPEGNRHSPQPVGCPADAECYVNRNSVPVGTLSAVRQRFAGAALTSISSVLANRNGRFSPDLVSRIMHVRAGPTDVTVLIHKPDRSDEDAYSRTGHGDLRIVTVTHAGPGFTVTVVVEQYGVHDPASRGTVERIARDERLVQPQ